MNIGGPDELTVLEAAELIRARAGSASPIRYGGDAEDDPRRRCPDIRLARRALGREPQTGVDEGLDRTLAWFRHRIATATTV